MSMAQTYSKKIENLINTNYIFTQLDFDSFIENYIKYPKLSHDCINFMFSNFTPSNLQIKQIFSSYNYDKLITFKSTVYSYKNCFDTIWIDTLFLKKFEFDPCFYEDLGHLNYDINILYPQSYINTRFSLKKLLLHDSNFYQDYNLTKPFKDIINDYITFAKNSNNKTIFSAMVTTIMQVPTYNNPELVNIMYNNMPFTLSNIVPLIRYFNMTTFPNDIKIIELLAKLFENYDVNIIMDNTDDKMHNNFLLLLLNRYSELTQANREWLCVFFCNLKNFNYSNYIYFGKGIKNSIECFDHLAQTHDIYNNFLLKIACKYSNNELIKKCSINNTLSTKSINLLISRNTLVQYLDNGIKIGEDDKANVINHIIAYCRGHTGPCAKNIINTLKLFFPNNSTQDIRAMTGQDITPYFTSMLTTGITILFLIYKYEFLSQDNKNILNLKLVELLHNDSIGLASQLEYYKYCEDVVLKSVPACFEYLKSKNLFNYNTSLLKKACELNSKVLIQLCLDNGVVLDVHCLNHLIFNNYNSWETLALSNKVSPDITTIEFLQKHKLLKVKIISSLIVCGLVVDYNIMNQITISKIILPDALKFLSQEELYHICFINDFYPQEYLSNLPTNIRNRRNISQTCKNLSYILHVTNGILDGYCMWHIYNNTKYQLSDIIYSTKDGTISLYNKEIIL